MYKTPWGDRTLPDAPQCPWRIKGKFALIMRPHAPAQSRNDTQHSWTRKQTWKAWPHSVADDIFWVVILLFDVHSLFFLSNFDSVPAKTQPWKKKKVVQSTNNTKESPVSSWKRKVCPCALQEVFISIPQKTKSVSRNLWEAQQFVGASRFMWDASWWCLSHCQNNFYARVAVSRGKIIHWNHACLFSKMYVA